MNVETNGALNIEAVRGQVKEIISRVTGIGIGEIGDAASFVDDLDLDSLSLLEIGVDVDYAFKLGVPEERLQDLHTVEDSVQLVVETLAARAPREEVA